MALLGVNIDHIATLRQARRISYPDPITAARMAQDAGADQITCHLREDRRHIQDADVPNLLKAVSIPVNLEMAATAEMEDFALKYRPAKITLVPERREELTTEGGLDVLAHRAVLAPMVAKLRQSGLFVSLFVDPEADQLRCSRELGADSVELHTGAYCEVPAERRGPELKRLSEAARLAKELGFFVAAGHGLNYENILPVKKIPEIEEYNIGHSIVAHAVLVGWDRAVREMKALVA
ncbi:pyridoxine 5'-phosphate synthase [Deltaproteobacteria bacterium PRO3]|nr:pyridoxine 5'-phosphate synthase [Deltaproteobacteria bacterium PRO3]